MGHMSSRRGTTRGAPTRTVVAVILAALVVGGGVAAAQRVFPDVPEEAHYADAVRWAADNGITTGAADSGEYLPDEPTTRGQMAVFLQRLDALVARRQLAIGPVTMSHPPTSAVARTGDDLSLSYEGSRVRVVGDGRVLVPLPGPGDLGGRNHVFSSVEYCLADAHGARVAEVSVLQSPDGGAVVPAPGPATPAGCHSYSGARSGWVTGQGATLVIELTGGGSVDLVSFSSTWVPS